MVAIGDCSLMVGDRLPATAQVAGQQGAYVAHLINRGFLPLQGGMDQVRAHRGRMGTGGHACEAAAAVGGTRLHPA